MLHNRIKCKLCYFFCVSFQPKSYVVCMAILEWFLCFFSYPVPFVFLICMILSFYLPVAQNSCFICLWFSVLVLFTTTWTGQNLPPFWMIWSRIFVMRDVDDFWKPRSKSYVSDREIIAQRPSCTVSGKKFVRNLKNEVRIASVRFVPSFDRGIFLWNWKV